MVSQKLLKKTTSLPTEKMLAYKYEKMVYKKVTERKSDVINFKVRTGGARDVAQWYSMACLT